MSDILGKYPKDSNNFYEKNTIQNDSDKISLERLGFDEWFEDKSEPYKKNDIFFARIIEVNKNNYKVSDGMRDISAKLSGKFSFNIENIMDFPTVGDWVTVEYFDNFSLAIIHDVLHRKSLLKRKNPGKIVDFQLIAANIDYAFIIQSANSNFNLNRLERYLVMINESNIQPIVVLSKTDLISAFELTEIRKKIARLNSKYLFLPISNVSSDGIKILQRELKANKTYCLLGSSGVGKTTLLNNLLGKEMFDVSAVREKDNKGRHTTSKRQLIRLDSGSIFIDTPGMREIGNFSVGSGIEETFDEIAIYSSQCRFRDCSHIKESGCAVIAAVEEGIIDEDRYENFLKIQKESAYYEMSHFEKRKKEKSFGKMYKKYKKSIRKK